MENTMLEVLRISKGESANIKMVRVQILQTNFQVNSFALSLLRDGLLVNLLQEDYPHILYWAGKEIARQFPTESTPVAYHLLRQSPPPS